MSDVNLGRLPYPGDDRDAVHVAIVPVVASEDLKPGDHVGLDSARTAIKKGQFIGIVDPFLDRQVEKGQTFWLCLYPKSVTGMSHHWSHPAFPSSIKDKEDHAAWLREYATRNNPYQEPWEAFERLCEGLKEGELFFSGSDLHGFYELPDPDELRRHAEAHLGIRIDWNSFTFSCSC